MEEAGKQFQDLQDDSGIIEDWMNGETGGDTEPSPVSFCETAGL